MFSRLFAEREALCRQTIKARGFRGRCGACSAKGGGIVVPARESGAAKCSLCSAGLWGQGIICPFVRNSEHFFMDATESHRFCQSEDFLPGLSTSSDASAEAWCALGCHVCCHVCWHAWRACWAETARMVRREGAAEYGVGGMVPAGWAAGDVRVPCGRDLPRLSLAGQDSCGQAPASPLERTRAMG